MPASFGDFSVGPDGRFLGGEPQVFQLLADFGFRDPDGLVWPVPAGTKVDGASIPRPFWAAIGGPFDGNYLNASIVHDHFCRTRTRTATATHRCFYQGMRAQGVPEAKAKSMFWAVSAFGPDWVLAGEERAAAGPMPRVDLGDAFRRQTADWRFEAIAAELEATDGERFPTGEGSVEATLDALEADAAAFRSVVAFQGGEP